MQGWKPASQPPEKEGAYVIFTSSGKVAICSWVGVGHIGWLSSTKNDLEENEKVTHWIEKPPL